MKYSKPASRVELVSIGARGVSIDDLLTVRIAPRINWLKRGVSVGDAGLWPATSLLRKFEDLEGFFDYVDLQPIDTDGLENLHIIGGDGDGHEYVVGIRSQRFYVLWHDPAAFEKVATTAKAFLQWVIRERSDHLEGCPWEPFTTKVVFNADIWHRDQVDPAPILDKAKELIDWDREYVSPLGFELLNCRDETDLRFKQEHRGHNSKIDIVARRKTRKIDAFLQWLEGRGFGRTWN